MAADQEGESRRLLGFLDLEWDYRVLEYHKQERLVTTASFWQARQPIYTSSVGRWEQYEKHLKPLLDAFELSP